MQLFTSKANRMQLEEWIKLWTYLRLGCLVLWARPAGTARPRFDTSTDMGLVLVPADAEVDSVIFRLRATDQDADFPLVFDITATITPIVRIENLPCTLYNKVCQANVILTKRLVPGRLHDFAVRVKDSKGDSNSMQATISVTNTTTQRDKIFPHIPTLIMVPEDTKPGKELDYILVRSNQWSGKPVYIELWQPKELFTIRQRQTPTETRGVITLIGELDFETQSMYTITMYATDPYTEPRRDTRNIVGLHLVVIIQDVQDVPPIFTLAPPLTKINNTVQPGDVILRVHAEDGDKGVPREVNYGLVSEGNPFTPFFNISETTGEIILTRTLEELTLITHVGAPIVLSVVAEEIRRSANEPPAQATVVEVGLLLGEPGNSPPFFENDNYVAWVDENAQPGSVLNFTEHYSTRVRDEDIGKAGVFALKLYNNNGTFEISPAVAERAANFIVTVRDNDLIDYERHKSLRFEIIAQEVGPATNLSATVPCTIFIRDVNDNAPEFDLASYEVTLSENILPGTRVIQVHATDKDTGSYGRIQYTKIIGSGNEGFVIDRDTGIITVAMGNTILDREMTASLQLSIEARDEDGEGLRGIAPLVVNILDINDNAPVFEKSSYEFALNEDLTNFTMPAIVSAIDADAEPPNNEVRYELVHGNYENKFYLNEITGELFLREPINLSKIRRARHDPYRNFAMKIRNDIASVRRTFEDMAPTSNTHLKVNPLNTLTSSNDKNMDSVTSKPNGTWTARKKRERDDILFTLTVRAYDLGVPHLSGVTRIEVTKGSIAHARLVSFVVPGENPDPVKTAETLAAITGGHITVQYIRPYTVKDIPDGSGSQMPSLDGERKSIVVARVEPNKGGTSLVDIERIRAALAANGVGVIGGGMPGMETGVDPKSVVGTTNHNTDTYTNITNVHSEEVTVYKAENKLLFWLLIILGLLMLLAIIALIICCICPGCPFYMAPRKRRVHSSETLIARSDGRPKRHLHRKPHRLMEGSWVERKQAWSADPARRNWQFNRRNQKRGGLASLPGDVHIIDREQDILEKAAAMRSRDGPIPIYSTVEQIRRPDDHRIYIEDVEGIGARGYAGMHSLRQYDLEHGLENPQQTCINEDEKHAKEQPKFVREQHFYRDGNAEILRFETREQMEKSMMDDSTRMAQTLVMAQENFGAYRSDGKDILLQRFIEDQKHRHANDRQDLRDSFPDAERRSIESHQRQKGTVSTQGLQHQPKIVLLPERLEEEHRQHIEEVGPEVQRLIIDHGNLNRTARLETKDSQEFFQGTTMIINAADSKVSNEKPKEQTSKQSVNLQPCTYRDLDLARQNALLTRILLGREGREIVGGALIDSASYLETQSLPGQVAIATQTDRTTATQTELPNRSRSDNDESEEEAWIKKKLKYKKRYGDSEPKRIRTLWMKSPIDEEEMQYGSEKRTIFLRKKMRDVKDSRRICLEPDVLREISDSLDENGEPPITARRKEPRQDSSSKEFGKEDSKRRLPESSSTDTVPREEKKTTSDQNKIKTDKNTVKVSHREKRENVVEPSFRILEKEMTSLSKKISRLTGKKILQSSNGSETESHETNISRTSVTAEKHDKTLDTTETKPISKETHATKAKRSKSTNRTIVSESPSVKERIKKSRDHVVDGKTQRTLKHKKKQVVSTGSSDFEEAVDKGQKLSPLALDAESSKKQAPIKSSYVKSTRHGKVRHQALGKSALVALAQETTEGKETSDSGSKGSIKSSKSEMSTVKTVKEHFCRASGNTSSDSLKDQKPQKEERPMLSNIEESTASEHLRASTRSDNLKTKEPQLKESNPEDITLQKQDETYDRLKSKEVKRGKMDIERDDEKIAHSQYSSDTLQSGCSKNGIQHKNASFLPNKPAAENTTNNKIAPETNDEAPGVNILKDTILQAKSRPTLDRKSAVEISDTKTESDSSPDTANLNAVQHKLPKQREENDLDRKKSIDDVFSSEDSEDQMPHRTETQIQCKKSVTDKAHDFSLVDDFQAEESQRITEAVSSEDMPPIGSEILGKLSDKDISSEVYTKSLTEHSVETAAAKLKRESPDAQKLIVEFDRRALDTEERDSMESNSLTVVNETIVQESDGSKEESVRPYGDHALTIAQEGVIAISNKKTETSVRALQNCDLIIDETAKTIKDVAFGTNALTNSSEGTPHVSDEAKVPQSVPLDVPDHFGKSTKDSTDTIKEAEKFEDEGKNVHQWEDEGKFSDNFEDVHSTNGVLKGLSTLEGSQDEIPYEHLQLGSAEANIGITAITRTKTLESQQSDSITPTLAGNVADALHPPSSASTGRNDIPETDMVLSPETHIKTKPINLFDGSKTELQTKFIGPINDIEDIQTSKSSEAEQCDMSMEEKTHQVSDVPPLNIYNSDQTVGFIKELSEQKRESFPSTSLSETSKSKTCPINSQKEYGIADSLFANAKILSVPSSPKHMADELNEKISSGKRSPTDEHKVEIPPVPLGNLSSAMLQDADDSDSSESSSKTMLTARPYGTPRHRNMTESKDIKSIQISGDLESITPTSVAAEFPELILDPAKIRKEELPDEDVEQILSTSHEQIDLKPDAFVQITENITASQVEFRSEISSPTEINESSGKEQETTGQILNEKPEIAVQKDDTETETTEKVQLSQIRQTKLSADVDGFTSLPETGIPMKNSENSTFLTGTTLPERTIKVPGDIREQAVEEFDIDTSNIRTDNLISTLKTNIVDVTLPEKSASFRNAIKPDGMMSLEETPLSENAEKIRLKISTENLDERKVQNTDKHKKTKPEAVPKKGLKGLKGLIEKKSASKEGLKKAREAMTPTVKDEASKNNPVVKAVKEEPIKLTKQTAAAGQLARPRDSKRQRHFTKPLEEKSNATSTSDRIRRSRKEKKIPDEVISSTQLLKVGKMKKKSKHEDEKSFSKQSAKTYAKQEQLESSRTKNTQDKDKKSDGAKIELISQVEKKNGDKAVHSEKEDSGQLAVIRPDTSRADSLITSSERLLEDDDTQTEESSLLEAMQPFPETRQPSENMRTEDQNFAEQVAQQRICEIETRAASIKKQESFTDKKLKLMSDDLKKNLDSNINETLSEATIDLTLTDKETEIRSASCQSETEKEIEQAKDRATEPTDRKTSYQSETEKETKQDKDRTADSAERKTFELTTTENTSSPKKPGKLRKEIGAGESQSRYMEWYKLKREEMERKRQDKKQGDEEEVRPKWLRKSTRQRWIKVGPEDKRIFDPQITQTTPFRRRKIRPLINVESEQLKAIVRQGRKLRRARGQIVDEPQIQIFAPENPPPSLCSIPSSSRYHHHHLIQHSEYKYEKTPSASFYLHPQTILNTSTPTPPQNLEDLRLDQTYSCLPTDSAHHSEIHDASTVHQQQQGANKLRHGELLEKKSVFDIAYSEAAPSQLRSDSTTPPS